MPGKLAEVAQVIGVEKARLFGKYFAGTRLDVPSLSKQMNTARDHDIQSSYNGYNARRLAAKYNITPRRVRQIAGAKEKTKNKKK